MKVRRGFVSNSSSSSFVIVVNKEDWDREYAALSDFARAAVDFVCEYEVRKEGVLNGNPIMMYGYTSGEMSRFNDDEPKFDGEIPEEYNDGSYIMWQEAIDKFDNKLKECQHLISGFDF